MKEMRILEAALFMSPDPMTINELTKIINAPNVAVTLKLIENLMKEFNGRTSALQVIKTSDNRFSMSVKSDYLNEVSHLAVSTDFSKAVLRTLGLIAVKQPVKQSWIVKVIGNKAYNYIKELQENKMIKTTRKGSTYILETTPKFESYFGKQAEEIKKLSGSSYQATL